MHWAIGIDFEFPEKQFLTNDKFAELLNHVWPIGDYQLQSVSIIELLRNAWLSSKMVTRKANGHHKLSYANRSTLISVSFEK